MAYEKDIKDLIAQMQRQQQGGGMSGMPPAPSDGGMPQIDTSMETDQSPHLMNEGINNTLDSVDQSPVDSVNSVRPMGTPISKTHPQGQATSNTPLTSSSVVVEGGCPDCGLIHPPIHPGQKCPMAPVKVKDGEEEKLVDVNRFLVDLKNIIISQIDIKKITDIEGLFKNIIVEVTKYLEEYKK